MNTGKLISVILIVLLMAFKGAEAQYQSYKINPANQYFASELSVKMNPKNTNQIVAGVMGSYSPLTTIMGYYYSTNSGINWSGGPMTCSFAQPGSDPIILVDTLGNFYYICCANWQIPGTNLDKLLIFKSTNGGMNWDGGTAFALMAPQMDDMPMACVDMSNSQYGNNIYVTWDLYDSFPSNDPADSCWVEFCRSTDGGNSFSIPVHVSRIPGTARADNSSPEGTSPCTGPNGEVYVCWPLNETVMFNRSTNAGVNWLYNDIYVCNQVGGWTGLGLKPNWSPVMACDISNSPYRGTVYICFADQRNGENDRDIWLVKSTNQGNTWSVPLRVNNDGPGNDQRLPWINVDKATGYVWLVFLDSRNNPITVSNAYVARSTDGGNTFKNIKISTTNIINSFYLGEYIGIEAFNNKVRPLWPRPIAYYGSCEVYATIIDSLFPFIEHVPLNSSTDTSQRTAVAAIDFSLQTGLNAPRLYYKTIGNPFSYVQAYEVNQSQYKFHIPGFPSGTKIYYYLAAQDSGGTYVKTLPEGGGGMNPPGTTPPPNLFYYEIFTAKNSCSVTLPKPILDNSLTADSIYVNYPGYIVKGTVNLSLYHPNDGDLILMLMNAGAGAITLSSRNGEGGSNYINTTFDDNASLSITQGSPPFSGPYRPQNPLTGLANQPVAGYWIFKILDAAPGSQGTLTNWCINFLVKSSIGINENETPSVFKLSQNYPNPFNSATRISYSIPKNSEVNLKIYDMLGREVRTLTSGYQSAGDYIVMFNSGDLSSGVYFYRLTAGDYSDIKRMVVIK